MTPEQELQIKQIIKNELSDLLKIDRYTFIKLVQFLDGRNIQTGTTTGTKIGTATTQKLGFYGVTPVDQPLTVTAPSTQSLTGTDTISQTKTEADLTSLKTAVNAIIARLQELGLIA